MKVGNSNCFLSKTESLGGFWVGRFSGEDIPKFNKNTDCPIDLSYPDLHFLSLFSSKRWRKKVKILTFSTNELIIWKIDDDLTYLSKVNLPKSEILSILGNKNNFKAVSSKTKKTLLSELDDETKYSELKFLRVSEEFRIQRASLLAPIDSLSVYRYLNQGTFRPIFRCGDDRIFPDFFKHDQKNLPSINIMKKIENNKSEHHKLTETDFGKFIRIYLNDFIDFLKGDRNRQYTYFRNLSYGNLYPLIGSILNPAQVETLAYHLLLDLNLIPDVGLGKGLDVVDVKASCRHYYGFRSRQIISKAIEALKLLKVNFSSDLYQSISKTKTIQIQCKAQNRSTTNPRILHLIPSKNWNEEEGNRKANTIYINTLIKAALKLEEYENSTLGLNNTKSFFDLLRYDLTRTQVSK